MYAVLYNEDYDSGDITAINVFNNDNKIVQQYRKKSFIRRHSFPFQTYEHTNGDEFFHEISSIINQNDLRMVYPKRQTLLKRFHLFCYFHYYWVTLIFILVLMLILGLTAKL